MKKNVRAMSSSLLIVMLLSACNVPSAAGETEDLKSAQRDAAVSEANVTEISVPAAALSETALSAAVSSTYYSGRNTPVFEYFQKSSIQRFLAMWVKEETGDIENPVWNLDSFTSITVLDHDLAVSHEEEQLYYCTFSDGGERYGYAIVKYEPEGPALGNWSITETTPCQYDLKPDMEKIISNLSKTDIDQATVKASRVYLFDSEKKRADQVIRFTDEKGDNYFCYFGDPSCEIVKW